MKSIVRRDTGEDWKEYLTRLMKEEGLIEEDDDPPSDQELRKFDKSRTNKKVSNEEWTSPPIRQPYFPDEGRHHAPRVESGARDQSENLGDSGGGDLPRHLSRQMTLEDSLHQGHIFQQASRKPEEDPDARGRQGLSRRRTARQVPRVHTLCTYIPEPERRHKWVWTDKPPEQCAAVTANRRRTQSNRGRKSGAAA